MTLSANVEENLAVRHGKGLMEQILGTPSKTPQTPVEGLLFATGPVRSLHFLREISSDRHEPKIETVKIETGFVSCGTGGASLCGDVFAVLGYQLRPRAGSPNLRHRMRRRID